MHSSGIKMKISKAFVVLSALLLVACGGKGQSSSSLIISSSSEESSEPVISSSSLEESSSSLPDPVGVFTKTVTFYNSEFTNSSLEQEASRKQFVDWFNGEDDVLESIDYQEYAQINYVGNVGDASRFSTLILGSQKKTGGITFNLSVQMISLKVVIQPYTKYIPFNDTYSIDTNATFVLDNKDYDISLKEGHTGDTKRVTIEKDYEEGANTFSIANKDAGQRVFVHSLEITYWG